MRAPQKLIKTFGVPLFFVVYTIGMFLPLVNNYNNYLPD